jgi:pectate lyase-like protein
MRRDGYAGVTALVATCLLLTLARASTSKAPITDVARKTWRSTLYPASWTPPVATPFVREMIQDFSYAGYHRGEAPIPDVSGPVFNVLDHGADSTGTRDSTGSIQQAIDAAQSAGGGVVHLPAGTYRIRPPDRAGEALHIRASNIVLRGDGPGRTFLFNDEAVMRAKAVIRVASSDAGDWGTSAAIPTAITTDLLTPTREIPVATVAGFAVGEWIVLRADATPAFIIEHRMSPQWDGDTAALEGTMFYREITGIDPARGVVVVDTPIRYQLKVRDGARVYPTVAHIAEVGLEHFSIGERQHPGSTLGEEDYLVPGTAAYDVHGASLISMSRTRNSWIRDVYSYRPGVNGGDFHMVSNGIHIGHSRLITIEGCDLARPQYRGGGGNGYMYSLHGQETLVKDSVSRYSRHGFVFLNMQASGNVLLRPFSQYSGFGSEGRGSDHHEHLSQSNLVDGATVDRDSFEARYRASGAVVEHGITAVQSVFWNTRGLAYYPGIDYVVHSQQFGYGYVIGTQGFATGVKVTGIHPEKTDPVDHVEGVGQGQTLAPASLYEDQLARRLGAVAPAAGIACQQPGRYVGILTLNDGASAVLRTRQRGPRRSGAVRGRVRCTGNACVSRRGVLSIFTREVFPPATGAVRWERGERTGPTCHIQLEEIDPACRRCRSPISCASPPDFAHADGTIELIARRCRRQLVKPGA